MVHSLDAIQLLQQYLFYIKYFIYMFPLYELTSTPIISTAEHVFFLAFLMITGLQFPLDL